MRGFIMKKLFLISAIMLCFATAYGQIIQNTANMAREALGVDKKNSKGIINNENAVNNQGETIYKESKFTANFDVLPFTLLTSMGGRQFSTDSYIIGVTWKLDQHWQIVSQVEKLKNESIDDVDYFVTHYLAGVGIRWYLADGVQAMVNTGFGSSEILRDDGDEQSKIKDLEAPVWFETKVLWVSDNTGYGVKLQALDMPNKAETEAELRNYGHVIITFSVDVGFSGIAGLVE
jgi:hypothetical protein